MKKAYQLVCSPNLHSCIQGFILLFCVSVQKREEFTTNLDWSRVASKYSSSMCIRYIESYLCRCLESDDLSGSRGKGRSHSFWFCPVWYSLDHIWCSERRHLVQSRWGQQWTQSQAQEEIQGQKPAVELKAVSNVEMNKFGNKYSDKQKVTVW